MAFANTHHGYKLSFSKFGSGEDSFTDFTDCFVKAIEEELYAEEIRWPSTPEEFEEIIRGMKRVNDKIITLYCLTI